MTTLRFRRTPKTELERAQEAEREAAVRDAIRRGQMRAPVPLRRRVVALMPLVFELAALADVIYGIGLIYRPAAWIVCGLALIASIEWTGRQRNRAAQAAAAAAATQIMTRGDLSL